MTLDACQPCTALWPFVKRYHIIESQAAALENRVLPGTSVAMSFRYRGGISYRQGTQFTTLAPTAVAGLQTTARLINYQPYSGTIVVLFREGMAAAFLPVPVGETNGLTIPLDELFPASDIRCVEEQLALAGNTRQRIACIEHFLLSRLRTHRPDISALQAVNAILASEGNVPVTILADRFGVSEDAFEKRFRKAIGTNPKQFAQTVRLQLLISRHRPAEPLRNLAFDSGFYDQPHFNRAFRQFTGLPPRQFFQQNRFW